MIDQQMIERRTAMFVTFGCKLNFAETSTVAQGFAEHGIRRAANGESPDIIVVNTCSVTETADRKCRQAIRSLHRRYPEAQIAVTGCYAQLRADSIAQIEGVTAVIGNDNKDRILSLLKEKERKGEREEGDKCRFIPSCSRGDRTRFFLKVQDGCDYWCSYCTIPRARGRSRSGTIDQLVAQAADAAAQGGREIVLTGVNIGDFGKGRDDTFLDLCRALDGVEGIERYRISSIEPNLLTDELIDFCAGSRAFMPHFHVPLQCGSDEVLRLMRRRYDTALFAHKVERIRHALPDAFIGVDLIVGARGETPELFAQSEAFCRSLDISRLHMFVYSERPGTRALELAGKVEPAEQQRRAQRMLALSADKLREFSQRFAGTVRPVLIEHQRPGRPTGGHTDNYLRVSIDDPAAAAFDNQVVPVNLDRLDPSGDFFHASLAGQS